MHVFYKGVKMEYDVEGSGKPLVILHGYGASSKAFESAAARFSLKRRVISPDFIGFGKSEMPNIPYTLEDYAESIEKLIRHLRLKSVDIICHSFGGRVALLMMARKKIDISSAILVAPAGIRTRNLKYYARVLKYKLAKIFKKDLSGYGSKDYLETPPAMRKTFINVVNYDLTRFLKEIDAPCLILAGEKDEEVPFSSLKKMQRKIKNANLETLFGGHFCYLEDERRFFDAAEDFLNGIENL